MLFILGVVVYLLGVTACMYLKGISASVLFNPAGVVVLILSIVGVLTATRSFKVFYCGLKAVVFPKKPLEEKIRGRAASLFRLLSKTVALASLIPLLCGVIEMGGGAFDGEIIRHTLSAAFIGPLLNIIIVTCVLEPVVYNLKTRQDTER